MEDKARIIFRVTRVNQEMVVTPDIRGNYRASSSEEVRRALSEPNFRTTTAEVRMGRVWKPLKRGAYIPKRNAEKRALSEPEPIKPLPRLLRILRVFHLYKDPLDILIYKGK